MIMVDNLYASRLFVFANEAATTSIRCLPSDKLPLLIGSAVLASAVTKEICVIEQSHSFASKKQRQSDLGVTKRHVIIGKPVR